MNSFKFIKLLKNTHDSSLFNFPTVIPSDVPQNSWVVVYFITRYPKLASNFKKGYFIFSSFILPTSSRYLTTIPQSHFLKTFIPCGVNYFLRKGSFYLTSDILEIIFLDYIFPSNRHDRNINFFSFDFLIYYFMFSHVQHWLQQIALQLRFNVSFELYLHASSSILLQFKSNSIVTRWN